MIAVTFTGIALVALSTDTTGYHRSLRPVVNTDRSVGSPILRLTTPAGQTRTGSAGEPTSRTGCFASPSDSVIENVLTADDDGSYGTKTE